VTGWFCIGLDAELPPGAVRSLRRFGRDLVLFRLDDGTPSLLPAFCPHMGGHLGAGCVEDGALRCPFHRFRFGADGACKGFGHGYSGEPGDKLRLRPLPLQVRDGFLLAWNDAHGRAPFIELPTRDSVGFSPIVSRSWTVRTHPQETGEGSVDLGHLSAVHLYDDVEEIKPILFDGPYLRAAYRAIRRVAPGMRGQTMTIEFRPALHGLGFSTVDVDVPDRGLHQRMWVLATPIDQESSDYRVAFSMRAPEDPKLISVGLALLPRFVARTLIADMTWKAFVHDVELDFPIWENKAYVHPPRLARGDGPIARFRQWATQFYPVAAASATSPRRIAKNDGITTTANPSAPPTTELQYSPE
jgi:nitrite reductase/ring-hydroxylating ferredoxin subunit